MLFLPSDPLPENAGALLGLKALGLFEARRLGLRVPPFFVLTTDLFRAWREHASLPRDLDDLLSRGIAYLERESGRRLGDADAPLLLSVRSGAPVSMPGMLATILDVGLTREVMRSLGPELGVDLRRRLLEGWASAVASVPHDQLSASEPRVAATSAGRAAHAADAAARVARLEATLADRAPPDDARAQLCAAIEGVLRSWEAAPARSHREAEGIDHALGTAVVVQAMVLGNAGSSSGAGVAYTRNPITGEHKLFGEFLPLAQGSDVVSGRASPAGLSRAASGTRADDSMEARCPNAYAELASVCATLEEATGDAQDVELTVVDDVLYVLQVRSAKRSPRAAIRIAVDLVREGRLDREGALARLSPELVEAQITRELPAPERLRERGVVPLARGVAASPGAARGAIALSAEDAVARAAAGEACVLVRPDCVPEDAPGIRAAVAVVTASGGLTSHAAVIARALGRPCVVSASPLRVTGEALEAREVRLAAGDLVSVDGARGLLYAGSIELELSARAAEVRDLLTWAAELDLPAWRALVSKPM